jgi:tellurite resistance protein TehA-like permease
MIEIIKDFLLTWKTTSSDRTKLQHTYLVASVALLLGAGVIGLFNREIGQNLLAVAVMAAGVFLINAVVWSLLQSAVLLRLVPRRTVAIKRAKKK